MRRNPISEIGDARRSIIFTAALLFFVITAQAQTGMRDRYFARVPFDKWKSEGRKSQIKWSAKVAAPRLSVHQRLLSRIEVQIDAKEADKRRDHGEFIVLLEVTDPEGRLWRTHETLNLTRIPEHGKANDILFVQNVLMRPGDYRLALALCDSQTLDHNFLARTIHVAPLHHDPLPDAWRDLPAVEFLRNFDAPESWYQPYVRGRLNLPLETRRPVHVELVMNLTPSDRMAASIAAFRRNMGLLIPALKLLSGLSIKDGSLDITLLDLTRQRAWEQTAASGLDWRRMREPLASSNPGIIDVQSLSSKAMMLQFFRDEVTDKLEAADEREPLRVVIVLSAPVFLDHQYKLDNAPFPKDPNRRIYYVRYRPAIPTRTGIVPSISSDDLEHVIKSLDGRMFSVITPEEFRKALAAILQEISQMP